MARIRSIKPEIRTSEKVNSWPIELRYFWVLLWGFCDDYGRGKDNARLIVADAFPLDDAVTATTVEGWMDALSGASVIRRYELAGARYFEVVNWREHQKVDHPSKTNIPAPGSSGEARETFASDSRDTRPRGGGGAGKGSREGEASTDAAPPHFCAAHPHGTTERCGACGDARRARAAWDADRKTQPTSIPPRELDFSECEPGRHKWTTDGTCAICPARREVAS